MIEPNIYYSGKVTVSQSVKEIGLHQPERLPEVQEWFEKILLYYLQHLDTPGLVDTDLIAPLFSDLIRLPGAERFLPIIRKFYDLGLVDQFYVGSYDSLQAMILDPNLNNWKGELHAGIFDHYSHILTTWPGYRRDEQGTASELELEQKRQTWQTRQPSADQRLEKKTSYGIEGNAVSDKVGRNEPCPCGSGKKYKKCCWRK